MKIKTRLFPSLILFLLLLVSACASAADTAPPTEVAIQPIVIEPTLAVTAAVDQPVTVDPASTDPAVIITEPVATSRGPDLHATDPSTVTLATGGLHFVEFFRFT